MCAVPNARRFGLIASTEKSMNEIKNEYLNATGNTASRAKKRLQPKSGRNAWNEAMKLGRGIEKGIGKILKRSAALAERVTGGIKNGFRKETGNTI